MHRIAPLLALALVLFACAEGGTEYEPETTGVWADAPLPATDNTGALVDYWSPAECPSETTATSVTVNSGSDEVVRLPLSMTGSGVVLEVSPGLGFDVPVTIESLGPPEPPDGDCFGLRWRSSNQTTGEFVAGGRLIVLR